MAKALTILDDALARAKTIMQSGGYSADYHHYLGELNPELTNHDRAITILTFEETLKAASPDQNIKTFTPVASINQMILSIEGHALPQANVLAHTIAQQMIADIKKAFLAGPAWTAQLKDFIYQGASWQPPGETVSSVQVKFLCEYAEKFADI